VIARALRLALVPLALAFGLGLAAGTAGAVTPRASLPDVESQVMCVTCGVPLDIAESPQADEERTFIRGLIAQGETTSQIKQALVAQLGPGVLGLPQRSGFNLAVYIVPVALIAILAGLLAVALPRWRRRGGPPDAGGPAGGGGDISADESARLDAELARYPD
jgi:cytochrome c-type biogenesis protein CcmH